MSDQKPQSTAAFAGKAPVTMDALKTLILADTALEGRKRKDIAWALTTLPRAFNLTLDTMPANPSFVSAQLKGFAPATAGLAQGTWSNALTLTRFAMRQAGIIKKPARNIVKFAPAWTALMKLPSLKHDQIALSRLARYCTEESIDPDDVNDQVFDAFLKDITENAIIRLPHKVHQRAATVWNKLANTTPNWPTQPVKVPSYSRTYFLGWDRFPQSLVTEIETHLDRMSGRDILAALDVRPLKPGSIKTRRHQLGAYLSGLVVSGEDPSKLATLADVVTVARVRLGLKFFLARAEKGSTARAHDIARMLLSIARHEVKAPPADLVELQAFCKRLDDGNPGMSEKNKKRLRQFDDDVNVAKLLGLPAKLIGQVKKEEGPPTEAAALRYQTALAVELLLMIPMRRENLTRLNVEEHIDRRRGGKVYVIIRGSEVKNGAEIEAQLPPHAVKMLDEYMKLYHPILTESASSWIFPGQPGRPKSRERMALQVSEAIKKEIGLYVHMHLFRHIAAKLYLDRNVGAYGVVQRLLGHKSIETTIRTYCGAEAKSATAHYDSHILELRTKRPAATKGRRRARK